MVSQRKAIFADVHGNYRALTKVLYVILHVRQIPSEDIICLGDLVGYYPQPNECVDLVRKLQIPIRIKGNHDEACGDPNFDVEAYKKKGWMPHALRTIEYARKQLSLENRLFLNNSRYMVREEDYELFHASPLDPEKFYYIEYGKRSVSAAESFAAMKTFLAFTAHSHKAGMLEEDLSTPSDVGKYKHVYLPNTPLQLTPGVKRIINVGSVGQPREEDDNRACFVVYEREEDEKEGVTHSVEFVRVEYSYEETMRKVDEANYGTVQIQGKTIDVGEHLKKKIDKRVII